MTSENRIREVALEGPEDGGAEREEDGLGFPNVRALRETPAALLCFRATGFHPLRDEKTGNGYQIWIPKSVIHDDSEVYDVETGATGKLVVKGWWAAKQRERESAERTSSRASWMSKTPPRGAEVPPPPGLTHLPKAPPGRPAPVLPASARPTPKRRP